MTIRFTLKAAALSAALLFAGAAQAQVSYIYHSDGRVSRVETHADGSHSINRSDGHWAEDGGAGKSHERIVREHRDPGDKVVREPKEPRGPASRRGDN